MPNLQRQQQQRQVDHRRQRRQRNASIRQVELPVFVFCDHELLEETLGQLRPEAVCEGHRSA
jgi:hypothetical protein